MMMAVTAIASALPSMPVSAASEIAKITFQRCQQVEKSYKKFIKSFVELSEIRE